MRPTRGAATPPRYGIDCTAVMRRIEPVVTTLQALLYWMRAQLARMTLPICTHAVTLLLFSKAFDQSVSILGLTYTSVLYSALASCLYNISGSTDLSTLLLFNVASQAVGSLPSPYVYRNEWVHFLVAFTLLLLACITWALNEIYGQAMHNYRAEEEGEVETLQTAAINGSGETQQQQQQFDRRQPSARLAISETAASSLMPLKKGGSQDALEANESTHSRATSTSLQAAVKVIFEKAGIDYRSSATGVASPFISSSKRTPRCARCRQPVKGHEGPTGAACRSKESSRVRTRSDAKRLNSIKNNYA